MTSPEMGRTQRVRELKFQLLSFFLGGMSKREGEEEREEREKKKSYSSNAAIALSHGNTKLHLLLFYFTNSS